MTAPPLDTTIAVVTPENIAFDYELAGPFRRAPAYAIDVLIRSGIILTILLVMTLAGFTLSVVIPPSFMFAAAFIAYFLISWFYGAAMETYFNGRTIGKWAMGLRVIAVDGRPLNGTRAVIRNLLRIADFAPLAALSELSVELPTAFVIPTGLVGLTCMLCTRRMQRLGDLAAGTMVVIDERSWRLPVANVDDPRAAAMAAFLPADFRVSRTLARTLATYVERRAYLTPARRREVAKALTDPLVARFGFLPDCDPDVVMMALYHATFLGDSRKTLRDELGAQWSPLIKDRRMPVGGQTSASSSTDKPLGNIGPVPKVTVPSKLTHPASTAETSALQPGEDR